MIFNTTAPGQPLIAFCDAWNRDLWGDLDAFWDPPNVVLSQLPDHRKGESYDLSFGESVFTLNNQEGDENA